MSTPPQVKHYDLNDLCRLVATFTASDLVTPAEPSLVMFLVKDSFGSVACYQYGAGGASVARSGTGAYYKDITLTSVGSWFYRAHATGLVQANEEWSILVDRSFIL